MIATPQRWACFFLTGFIAGLSGVWLSEKGLIHLKNKPAFRLDEPLLIEGVNQNSYSLLPVGTVLYYDKNWDEGHSTYHVYFHFKGEFKSTPAHNPGIDPIWLRTIPGDELPKLIAAYPVSRDQLVRILKAQKITKQEVAQILRDWKD